MIDFVSATTTKAAALKARNWFTRRSVLTQITRDGVTAITVFVPTASTPERVAQDLRGLLPANATVAIHAGPTKPRAACRHDWRTDPNSGGLIDVCALCGEERA